MTLPAQPVSQGSNQNLKLERCWAIDRTVRGGRQSPHYWVWPGAVIRLCGGTTGAGTMSRGWRGGGGGAAPWAARWLHAVGLLSQKPARSPPRWNHQPRRHWPPRRRVGNLPKIIRIKHLKPKAKRKQKAEGSGLSTERPAVNHTKDPKYQDKSASAFCEDNAELRPLMQPCLVQSTWRCGESKEVRRAALSAVQTHVTKSSVPESNFFASLKMKRGK